MWICAKCKREFKTKNQSHSCVIIDPEELLSESLSSVRAIYKELRKHCLPLGEFKIDTTKSCMYFIDQERFLVIKPKKSSLILEFVLNNPIDVFPVIKVIKIGKNKYAHRLVIEDSEDLTSEVLGWIFEAHALKRRSS